MSVSLERSNRQYQHQDYLTDSKWPDTRYRPTPFSVGGMQRICRARTGGKISSDMGFRFPPGIPKTPPQSFWG